MDQRTRRSPARFLAPLALVAVLFVFLAIVAGSGDDGSKTSTNTSGTQTETSRTSEERSGETADERTETERSEADRGPRTYRVQVGDTLGGIADKTGVPLDRIEELNPDVDPQAMTAGQRIKLR